jgi:hypothetical protein
LIPSTVHACEGGTCDREGPVLKETHKGEGSSGGKSVKGEPGLFSAAANQVVVYICHRQIHAFFDNRARGSDPRDRIKFNINNRLQLFERISESDVQVYSIGQFGEQKLAIWGNSNSQKRRESDLSRGNRIVDESWALVRWLTLLQYDVELVSFSTRQWDTPLTVTAAILWGICASVLPIEAADRCWGEPGIPKLLFSPVLIIQVNPFSPFHREPLAR